MKTTFILLFTLLSFSFQVSAEIVNIDTQQSTVKWTGTKIGGSHWGYIKLKSGFLELKGDKVKGGEFIIDMNSMDVQDIKNPEYNKKLVNHLKDADFFDVKKYPTAKFKVTKATSMPGSKVLDGNLTIRGITKKLSIKISEKKGKASSQFSFNRAHYGLKYKSKSFFDVKALGDKVIHDEVKLEVALVYGKKAAGSKYKVDTKKSKLKWVGYKIAENHTGHVKVKKGSLIVRDGHLVGGSFEIDMNSITVADIKNKKYNKKLVDHLKNDDFFSVKKHPRAKVVIKDSMMGKGGAYDIVADLTVKGITKTVMFQADFSERNGRATANAKVWFDRTKYKVKYNSKSFFDLKALGDKLIKDKVLMEVSLTAKN